MQVLSKRTWQKHFSASKSPRRLQKLSGSCKIRSNTRSFTCTQNWSQQQITTVIRSSLQKRAEHWARAAKAVYITNIPFSHYENKYVAAHLHGLDSSYKGFFSWRFGGLSTWSMLWRSKRQSGCSITRPTVSQFLYGRVKQHSQRLCYQLLSSRTQKMWYQRRLFLYPFWI